MKVTTKVRPLPLDYEPGSIETLTPSTEVLAFQLPTPPVRPRKKRSLRTRLVLLVAALLASVALALLIFLPARIESRARGLVESRAVAIATLLAKSTGPALEFDDETAARERLNQIATTPDAIYATVVRADGSALATWRAEARERIEVVTVSQPGVSIHESVLQVAIPIATKGGTHGSLIAGFNLEELERERAAAFRLVAITSAIVLVLGLGVAFLIGTYLVRPITKMTEYALRISENEAATPDSKGLDTERPDELGTMARAFMTMLSGLNRHRSFLECQSEASGDGILIISEAREVLSYNQRFLEVWPLEEDSIPTTNADRLLKLVSRRAADPKAFRTRVRYIMAHPEEEATDEIRLADGRVYDCHTAPIKSAAGVVFGRGWYFREITDRKRAEDQIRALNTDLERRVDERTQALELANKELAARFAQLHETQRALMEASRKSGMADVATAVLHNVGNVLNSVNVSANLVLDRYRTSRVNNLHKAVELLTQHKGNLSDFFTKDPRGGKLPGYLEALVQAIDGEREVVTNELKSLQKNVDHIKVIVSRQQANAKLGGVEEPVTLESLLDDAVEFNTGSLAKLGIVVTKEYEKTRAVTCDRHKAYQIVMNFLANAKDALAMNPPDARRVVVRTRMVGDEQVVLEVEDNGVGIAPEHLGKIFNHGFTTKPTGHGFGLHSSACCALEMGGSVGVESAGVGLGARFRLTMPVHKATGVAQGRTPTTPPPFAATKVN